MRTLSLTKTAEILHLAQSTVSHRLKKLEDDIGIQLIERKRGQKFIRLTPKGQEFISIAERLSMLRQETHALKSTDPQLSLSIGSVDSLNTTILISLYQRLIAHTPKCRLKIITKTSPEIYEMIEKHEIDVGFVLREINSSNVIISPVFSDPMIVISGAFNKMSKKTIHPYDLDPKNEIFFYWGPTYLNWHNRWWDPQRSSQLEVDTIYLIRATLLENPHYWSIVPKSMLRSFPLMNKFTVLELSDAPPNRVCYQIMHRYPYYDTTEKIELVNKYLKDII